MHRFMRRLAHSMAIVGGLVLVALIAITCISIIGRLLNTAGHSGFVATYLAFLAPVLQWFRPVNGDYELVEAGVAFALFAFLPWCQLNRGHAKVELLTAALPATTNRYIALVWETVFAAVLALISWRIAIGMSDKMRYGETTFLLQFPVWWAFALCTAASIIATLVAFYSVWLHVAELKNTEPAPAAGGSRS